MIDALKTERRECYMRSAHFIKRAEEVEKKIQRLEAYERDE